jgi:hypothetical protein
MIVDEDNHLQKLEITVDVGNTRQVRDNHS